MTDRFVSMGKVVLLDHMGSDLTVVNAARCSFDKKSDFGGDGLLLAADAKLIYYLAKHDHHSPFTHPTIQLYFEMPLFVKAQWIRHRVGIFGSDTCVANINEVSRRYIKSQPTAYIPSTMRRCAANVKQGSSNDVIADNEEAIRLVSDITQICLDAYDKLLALGVCPEQSRMILGSNTMTSFQQTGSLLAFSRIFMLRNDPSAQKEIQEYAKAVGEIVSKLFPVSWDALTVHVEDTLHKLR